MGFKKLRESIERTRSSETTEVPPEVRQLAEQAAEQRGAIDRASEEEKEAWASRLAEDVCGDDRDTMTCTYPGAVATTYPVRVTDAESGQPIEHTITKLDDGTKTRVIPIADDEYKVEEIWRDRFTARSLKTDRVEEFSNNELPLGVALLSRPFWRFVYHQQYRINEYGQKFRVSWLEFETEE